MITCRLLQACSSISLVSVVGPCYTQSPCFCSALLICVTSVSMWVFCSFFIDRQCNDALWMSPAGCLSCHTPVSSHCYGMSISCPSAWPLFSPVSPCFMCDVSASRRGPVHLCDRLSALSFSWQVWRSRWGWWRGPEASARGELLPLLGRTVAMQRGSTRSMATMLSSVTASRWTGASLTTGQKSMSTSCVFPFFLSYMFLLSPTALLLFSSLAVFFFYLFFKQMLESQFNLCST